MMLFDGTLLMAGGSIIAIACLDKVAEQYGFRWLGNIIKILLPFVAIIAGAYFVETNEILRWLR